MKILCQFCCVNILLFCETLRIEQTKNNVAKLLQLYAFYKTKKKKKKMAGETVQVEQIENTITSRHSLFIYIYIYIYIKQKEKQIGVLEKKKIHFTRLAKCLE